MAIPWTARVETWVSSDEVHTIEGLKTGEEYTLRETVAPEEIGRAHV